MNADINADVQAVIARVDAWRGAASLTAAPQPGGKTNANYLITADGERFVLRLSGQNTADLGIDRHRERAALLAASSIGVAPEVTAYLLPEGHLITRFIAGAEWSPEEFRQPAVVARVAETLRRVHALPAIEGAFDGGFDPYRDIAERPALARSRGLALPPSLDSFRAKAARIQAECAAALDGDLSLCHNDPWHNNFLDDGTVRLLDWEFAGMGDPFFDLASVAGASSPAESAFLLECYFGAVTQEHLRTLEDVLFVVILWNATWALIQIGALESAIDYAGMAQGMFDFLAARI